MRLPGQSLPPDLETRAHSERNSQDPHTCSWKPLEPEAINWWEHLNNNFDEMLDAECELYECEKFWGDLNLRVPHTFMVLPSETPPGSHGERSGIALAGSNYCEMCPIRAMHCTKGSTTVAAFKDEGRML